MKSFINFPVNLTCFLDILNIMELAVAVRLALDLNSLNFVREHSGKKHQAIRNICWALHHQTTMHTVTKFRLNIALSLTII